MRATAAGPTPAGHERRPRALVVCIEMSCRIREAAAGEDIPGTYPPSGMSTRAPAAPAVIGAPVVSTAETAITTQRTCPQAADQCGQHGNCRSHRRNVRRDVTAVDAGSLRRRRFAAPRPVTT